MNNEQMIALSAQVMTDQRVKPLIVTVSSARKIVVWSELAMRSPVLGHALRRDVQIAVRLIDQAAKPVVGHGIRGQKTMRGEQVLLLDEREITVNLTVCQMWLLLLAAQVAVRHPQVADTQVLMIKAIAKQIQAGLDEDIPGLSEYADVGWNQANDR